MYQTEAWRIQAPRKGLRVYQEREIFFLRGIKVKRTPELEEHIQETWKIETSRNPGIGNGPLLRLAYFEQGPRALDLEIELTDYQEYKATCIPEHNKRFLLKEGRTFIGSERAHTFASAVLPVTLDEKVVFLERSTNVDLFKGMLNLPSGGVWDGNPEETLKNC